MEKMNEYQKWKKEVNNLSEGKSSYVWDELEELITDAYEEEKLTSGEFDELMEQLMEMDCE